MKTKIKTYVGTALVACSLSFNSLFLYIIVYVMFFGAGIVIPIFRDFRAIFGVFRIE